MLIHAATSCLIVIDMQERLVPVMQAPARTIRNARTLIAAATELEVPILLTEQYPKGLGATVPEIAGAAAAANATILPKMHFSCMEDRDFAAAFKATGRKQAVIAGMEAHICVLQTAVSLMDQGFEVFVVTDATSSRTLESEKACLDRLQACGAGIVTTEMVVFEWLGRAGTPAFKALLALVK
ncbi:MAG: hydrolase [Alphaproteobacteria bacterium]